MYKGYMIIDHIRLLPAMQAEKTSEQALKIERI
ncbi:hypothetical protein MTsPCn9_28040 [Croceitalea sp. MTPC9]|nr:hypothetical protein MTsPCn6_22140 [Croceitalea sp. MTPC6]GMN17866.1 hypothetical protein MTsPCn9_28040 [Croceitalea sp. MTPC9]